MGIFALSKKILKGLINGTTRVLLDDIATLHRPFLGYDYLKKAYLIARDMGVMNFAWKATKTHIKNYSTFTSVVSETQTMVEEGHLGGYVYEGARGTYNPLLWRSLIELLNIQSVLDIGCGRGFSLSFFAKEVPFVVGTEGAIKALETSLIPEKSIQHDYTEGASTLSDKFDLIWCCEVVEHIEEQYVSNLIKEFKKSQFLAMTYAIPGQGGYHHVNEQFGMYWIRLLSKNGFHFCKTETKLFRKIAILDELKNNHYNHFAHKGLFFINQSFNRRYL